MVKKIIGYDDKGGKVFERDAREYDKSVSNMLMGISIGDIVKAVPIFFLCGTVYMHQQDFNEKVLISMKSNSDAIGGIKEVLAHLDSSLTQITGKQFLDGMPR